MGWELLVAGDCSAMRTNVYIGVGDATKLGLVLRYIVEEMLAKKRRKGG